MKLVDFLFDRPAVTVRNAKDRMGVTDRAARNAIDKLVDLSILVEIAGAYPKIFISPRILRVATPE